MDVSFKSSDIDLLLIVPDFVDRKQDFFRDLMRIL